MGVMQTRRARARKDAMPTAVSTAAVLDLVLQCTAVGHTSIKQLAQCCVVSKQWAEAITRFVNDQAAVLVPGAAYQSCITLYGRHEQQAALEWLLAKQEQQLEHGTLSQLVRMPCMPADVIEAVLDTGARMDMQQLAAAGGLKPAQQMAAMRMTLLRFNTPHSLHRAQLLCVCSNHTLFAISWLVAPERCTMYLLFCSMLLLLGLLQAQQGAACWGWRRG